MVVGPTSCVIMLQMPVVACETQNETNMVTWDHKHMTSSFMIVDQLI